MDGKRVNLPYIKLGVLSVMQDGYRVILRTNEGRTLMIYCVHYTYQYLIR